MVSVCKLLDQLPKHKPTDRVQRDLLDMGRDYKLPRHQVGIPTSDALWSEEDTHVHAFPKVMVALHNAFQKLVILMSDSLLR